MTVTPHGDRCILHVDMDAFYASVEALDHPEYRGKPLLVAGDPGGRGVVSAASYEARRFGCRSAMPTATAIRLCPQAIVVPPRMQRYVELSRRVFDVLERFTPLIEPLSIDEAFLDVTGSRRLFGDGERMAAELKRLIRGETGLTASVGVAPNKFVAKLASDARKPDGLVVVPPDGVQAFLDPLAIERLWGVGKATLPRFERLGIRTFGDARRLAVAQWSAEFGDGGARFAALVRGLDDRPVVPDREARSISHEVTFAADVADRRQLRAVLLEQSDRVAARLRRAGLWARTVGLKLRYPDFRTLTRRSTLDDATDQTDLIWTAAAALFDEWARKSGGRALRLLGMGVSQLSPRGVGQQLLFQPPQQSRRGDLDHAVDEIRQRFGADSVARGAVLGREPEGPRPPPPPD